MVAKGRNAMFNNILIAFDGSECSKNALTYAKNMAEQYNAALWLVHVFPHTSDLLGYTDYEKLFSRRKGAGQAVLDSIRDDLGETSFEVHEELLEGPEAEAILKVAADIQSDLIINDRSEFAGRQYFYARGLKSDISASFSKSSLSFEESFLGTTIFMMA